MSITIFNTNPGGGGGTVTADNGLNIPSPGGPVELGGTLIKATDIDRAGFELFIHDESDPDKFATLDLTTDAVSADAGNNVTGNETTLLLQAGAGLFAMDNSIAEEQAGVSLQSLGAGAVRGSLFWRDETTGFAKRISLDRTSFLVEDQINQKGLENAADYTGNFTANSLITAQFFFAQLNPKTVAAGRAPGATVTGQLINYATQGIEATYRANVVVTYVSGTGTITPQIAWTDETGTARTFNYPSLSVIGTISNNPPFVLNAQDIGNIIVSYIIAGTVNANVNGYLELFQ